MLRTATMLLVGAAAIGGAIVGFGKFEKTKTKKTDNRLLDEALDETFPASDAISPSAGQLSHMEMRLREKAKKVA